MSKRLFLKAKARSKGCSESGDVDGCLCSLHTRLSRAGDPTVEEATCLQTKKVRIHHSQVGRQVYSTGDLIRSPRADEMPVGWNVV